MNKKTSIITTLMAAMLLVSCNALESDQDDSRIPIRLTTSIAQTRSVTPTQETVIATGQNIYVWANEEATPGTADWTQNAYLSAWRLTKGDDPEWSSQSSQPYYPSRSMSMVALHGNFQPAVVEERTEVPATIIHQVKTDQRQLADYAASDLLYWNQNGINAVSNNPIVMQFVHKLSKIEIELVSAEMSATDLADAIVTLNGLQTSTVLTVTDATPSNMGTVAAASGAAQTILPYAAAGNQREAIIPPQDKPASNMITVSLHGQTYNLSPAEPTSAFETNKRYIYTVTLTHTAATLQTSVSEWGAYTAGGESPVTLTDSKGVMPINIKMNPLWYVAETNVDYTAANGSKTWDSGAGKFYFSSNIQGGYYFSWADALKYFTTSDNVSAATPVSLNGYYQSNNTYMLGWHLPTQEEYNSIYPGRSADGYQYGITSLVSTDGSTTTYNNTVTNISFGFNDETKGTNGYMHESSFWYRKSASIYYAIRYCATPYCSAWKYEWVNNTLIISSTLLGYSLTASEAATEFGTDENKWNAVTFGNDESKGAVQRKFYTTGHKSNAYTSNSVGYYGERGNYWMATQGPSNNSYAQYFHYYNTSTLTLAESDKANGDMIRLFRNNPDKDVLKNPLWYVAEYNMTNAPGAAATLTMASTDDAGYFYNWADAMTTFGISTSSYDGYKKGNKVINGISGKTWHLPTLSEFLSIVPCTNAMNSSGIQGYDDGTGTYKANLVKVNYGYNYETKTTGVIDNSFWHKVSDHEIHAIRFLGTPYCSAWKYCLSSGFLTIYTTMIDPIDAKEYDVRKFYNEQFTSIYFGSDVSMGAVQRTFYYRGLRPQGSSSASSASSNIGSDGYFYTATARDATNSWAMNLHGNMTYFYPNSNGYCFSIRLFLDN